MSDTTVYVAKKIITMNPRQPEATHLAVRDGRILAVGDLAWMQAWGEYQLDTRFADQVLMPGLVEGHCHLKEGGMWVFPYVGWFDRTGPDGRLWQGLQSMDAVVDAMKATADAWDAAGKPADEPLVVWGFDPIYFGVVFVINNAIGLVTPPVGTTLNVVCGVTQVKMDRVIVGVWPFMLAQLVVMALLIVGRPRRSCG